MNYFKKISYIFKYRFVLNEFINNVEKGYFKKTGWLLSYKKKSPLNNENQPIPWVTYSFLQFIDDRLNKDMVGFEYGSGSSSLYFSRKIKEVYSFEHNEEWHDKLKNRLSENVHLTKVEKDNYSSGIHGIGKEFDFILVDGIDRVACIKDSFKNLSSSGVIILDDSEREEYFEGTELLRKEGFKELPFWGFSPGSLYMKCTSIFYKSTNIFNI